jgi:hypothetical protein
VTHASSVAQDLDTEWVATAHDACLPSHIFGIVTRCLKRTRALLLLSLLLPLPPLLLVLLLLVLPVPLLLGPELLLLGPLLLLLPVTMATPSAGPNPSLSRMAGVMRDRYEELSMRKSTKPVPAGQQYMAATMAAT